MSEHGARALDQSRAAFTPGTSRAPETGGPPGDLSLGELVGRMSSDLSVLFRQEVALAKTELKEEAAKAGKGAGMFGGTAVAGYMALLLLSFAAAWGLAEVIPTGFAFLLVGAVFAVVAAVLFLAGKRELKTVHGPEKTVQTIKEDAQWARHPKS